MPRGRPRKVKTEPVTIKRRGRPPKVKTIVEAKVTRHPLSAAIDFVAENMSEKNKAYWSSEARKRELTYEK